MSDDPANDSPADATPQTIAIDVPCSRCGYNLRGLTSDMRCPECGVPVERSTHGNLLRYADPDWLDRLRRGVALKLWNIVIGVVLGGGGGLLLSVGMPLGFFWLLSSVGGLLGLGATFLLTTQEPAISLQEDPITLRKVIRTTAAAGMIGGQLTTAGQMPGGAPLWIMILGYGASLLGVVATFGEFVYLRRFARRIPSEKLAKSTTTVLYGMVSTMVLLFCAGIVAVLGGVGSSLALPTPSPGSVSGGTFALMAVFGCVGFVGFAVFAIWNIRLLFQYHRAFKYDVAEARRITWT